jgi:hypothetical protein
MLGFTSMPDGRPEQWLTLLQWFATIGDLEDAAAAINRYCQAFVALHEKIYSELKIEG